MLDHEVREEQVHCLHDGCWDSLGLSVVSVEVQRCEYGKENVLEEGLVTLFYLLKQGGGHV